MLIKFQPIDNKDAGNEKEHSLCRPATVAIIEPSLSSFEHSLQTYLSF